MKFPVIFICTLVLLECQARHKRRYEAEETCTTELKLNRAKMKTLVNEDNTSENNKAYGEFLVCVFKKRGVMNQNGTINENALWNFLHLVFTEDFGVIGETKISTVQHVLEQCKTKEGDTVGKTAIKLKNCIVKYIKEFDSGF